MGIENEIKSLASPTDALKLCDGFFNNKDLPWSLITDKNVLDAAEVLIVLGEVGEYKSRANVIESALAFGWHPIDWDGPHIPARRLDESVHNGHDVFRFLRFWQE